MQVARVTESLLAVMKGRIARGRWFLEEEDAPGRNLVAVVSHGLWMRRFGGDPAIVGHTIVLNAVPRLVVGVMAPDDPYPARTDVWIPIAFTSEQRALSERGSEYLDVIARLAPGISLDQARASLDALGQRLRTLYGIKVNWTIRCATLDDDLRGDVKPVVLFAFCAVGLVFLIACANLANLMLARSTDRRREFALRLAIGAAPRQIRAQSLVEAMTLAAIGGATGLMLAIWLSPLLPQLGARAGLSIPDAGVDLPVVLFALAATLASALIMSILPSWQVSRASLNELLSHAGRGSIGAELTPTIVVGQVALAFVVVASAALLVKSVTRLSAVDPGFAIDERLSVRVTLPVARYPTRPERDEFYARFFEALGAVRGVRTVGGVSELPLSTQRNMASFDIEHQVVPPGQPKPHADMRSATPGYFDAMGIRLVGGRPFSDRDRADAPAVAIVDDAVVRLSLAAESDRQTRGARNRSGRSLAGDRRCRRRREARFARGGDAGNGLRPAAAAAHDVGLRGLEDRRRSDDDCGGGSRSRQRLDPDLPLYDVATLRGRLNDSIARRQITALVVGAFAALALILALTGVYGVIAYAVSQRTREIGVRMALGAQTTQVLRMFVRSSMRTAISGILVGTALTIPLMYAGASLLFEVVPYDPVAYLMTAAAFLLLSGGVSLLSARRAATVDPLIALRQ